MAELKLYKCIKCFELKPLGDYYRQGKYYDGMCKVCKYKNNQLYRNVVEPSGFSRARRMQLTGKWKITMEEFLNLVKNQDGCCACCGNKLDFEISGKGSSKWGVDHDHTYERITGKIKIRGILCNNCNSGLGFFGDSQEQLQKAIDYLGRNK